MPLDPRRNFTAICLAAAALGLAGSVIAQPLPKQEVETDAELRSKVKAQIDQCIQDKVASTETCRMIAYSAALAAGFPPKEAARITGYTPK